MRILPMLFGVLASLLGSPLAAAPCDSDYWQPTFVHDLENEDGPWFVTRQGAFIKLQGASGTWVTQACQMIESYGLRDRRGFTSCQEYTRVQCGCSRNIRGNTTCASFLARRNPAAAGGSATAGSTMGSGAGTNVGGTPTGGRDPWGVWANRMNPNLPWSDPCNIQYVQAVRPARYDNQPDYRLVRIAQSRGGADELIRTFSQFYDDQPDFVVKMSACRGSTEVTTRPPGATGVAGGGGHGVGTIGGLEYNTNRYGSDYKGWNEIGTTPEACRDDCLRDPKCKSFSWVKPGTQGTSARCWLKHSVPPTSHSDCCVSGVKLSDSGGGNAGNIVVVDAIYGGNCGHPIGVVQNLAAACEGKSRCDYRVDHRVLGDPAVGCRKDYVYRWQCGYGTGHRVQIASVDGEASGRTAALRCD